MKANEIYHQLAAIMEDLTYNLPEMQKKYCIPHVVETHHLNKVVFATAIWLSENIKNDLPSQ